jgi:hypothetical protein
MATVASSATSVTILAANAQRKGATIHNTDANRVDIHLGVSAATTATRHYYLNFGDTLELPANYTGDVQGIWTAAGSGGAMVREF